MMTFILALSGNCTDPGLASLLAVAKKFMNILWIVGPILAIIGAGIAFYKLMSNPEEKKYKSIFKNMLIDIIMLFLVPRFDKIIAEENLVTKERKEKIEKINSKIEKIYLRKR